MIPFPFLPFFPLNCRLFLIFETLPYESNYCFEIPRRYKGLVHFAKPHTHAQHTHSIIPTQSSHHPNLTHHSNTEKSYHARKPITCILSLPNFDATDHRSESRLGTNSFTLWAMDRWMNRCTFVDWRMRLGRRVDTSFCSSFLSYTRYIFIYQFLCFSVLGLFCFGFSEYVVCLTSSSLGAIFRPES